MQIVSMSVTGRHSRYPTCSCIGTDIEVGLSGRLIGLIVTLPKAYLLRLIVGPGIVR